MPKSKKNPTHAARVRLYNDINTLLQLVEDPMTVAQQCGEITILHDLIRVKEILGVCERRMRDKFRAAEES